jgi:hypothetical protein
MAGASRACLAGCEKYFQFWMNSGSPERGGLAGQNAALKKAGATTGAVVPARKIAVLIFCGIWPLFSLWKICGKRHTK